MSIVFFEMQGCGHCVNSKQVLSDAIAQGLVVVKPAAEAGSWAKGFPAFHSKLSDKTHLGAVSSYEELCKLLEHNTEHNTEHNVENFQFSPQNSWGIGVL